MKHTTWVLYLFMLLASVSCSKQEADVQIHSEENISIPFTAEIDLDELRKIEFNLGERAKTNGVVAGSSFTADILFAYSGITQPISVSCDFEYDNKTRKFIPTEERGKANNKRFRTVTIPAKDKGKAWFTSVVVGLDPKTGQLKQPATTHKKIARRDQSDSPQESKIDMSPYAFASPWTIINAKELSAATAPNSHSTFTIGQHTLKPLGYYASFSFENKLPKTTSLKIKKVHVKGNGVAKTFAWNLLNIQKGQLPTAQTAAQSDFSFDPDETLPQNQKGAFYFVYFMPTSPSANNEFYLELEVEGTPKGTAKATYRSQTFTMPALTNAKGNHGRYFGFQITHGDKPSNPNAFPIIPAHDDIVNPINGFFRSYVISTDAISSDVVTEAGEDNYNSVNGIGSRHLIDPDQSRDFKAKNKTLLTSHWTPKANATPNGRVYPTLGDFTALFPLYDTDLTNMNLNTDFDRDGRQFMHDWFNIRMGAVGRNALRKKIIRNKKGLSEGSSPAMTTATEPEGKTLYNIQIEQPMEVVTLQTTQGTRYNVILGAEYIINANRTDQTHFPNNVVYGKRFIGGYDMQGFSANGDIEATDLNNSLNFIDGNINAELNKKFPKNSQLSAWRYKMNVVKLSGKSETIHMDIWYCYLGPSKAGVSVEQIADEDWWANQQDVVKVTYKFPRFNSFDYIGHITKSYAPNETDGIAFLIDKHRFWKEHIPSVRSSTTGDNYLRLGVVADPQTFNGAGLGN